MSGPACRALRPGTGRPGHLEAAAAAGPPGDDPSSRARPPGGRDPRRIISVVAPPGYGKTTLLAQWAELSGPAFAWVSVDERDNDPKILLSYVARALDAVQPVGRRVFDALAAAASSVPGSVVPRLGAAFASMTVPVVLVLDDVHLLENQECRDALSVLAEHVPPGSRLVLAGRAAPPLRVARLRAEGRLLEVGPADLALTRPQAAALLARPWRWAPARWRRCISAPKGGRPGCTWRLHLAALHLREGGSLGAAAVSFGGDDRLVSEYIEAEFLATISRRQRTIPDPDRAAGADVRAAVRGGARTARPAATLAELARSNLLLVPLDRRGVWYRYHHLFRDMLLAELERPSPAYPDPAPAGRRLVPGQRPARGRAGVLDRRRGRRRGRPARGPGWRPSMPIAPGLRPCRRRASSLTAAELRVLPMLATHCRSRRSRPRYSSRRTL